MNTVAQLVERVKQLQALSNQLWDAACDDDRDFREQADDSDTAYDAAIEAIEKGDYKTARTELESARTLEDEGGDSQHAQDALKALDEHLEELWWAWHDADSSRHSPGEDADEATADAEERCENWVRGYNKEDGPVVSG